MGKRRQKRPRPNLVTESGGPPLRSINEAVYEGLDLSELVPIEESIAILDAMRRESIEILASAASIGVENLRPQDSLVIAAVMRSNAMISGFLRMVEDKNRLCALPMVRAQLDSAMRIYASNILDQTVPITEYAKHILEGGQPSKYLDRSGKSMRDGYLRQKLDQVFPEFSNTYNKTSGYVHLSNAHIFATIDHVTPIGDLPVLADVNKLPAWDKALMQIDFVEFIYATDCLLEICRSWSRWKMMRDEGDGGALEAQDRIGGS
jgi:hypothetical protein